MADIDHTWKLASFLAVLKYEDLSPQVVQQAKFSIVNGLGCGLGSSHSSPVQKVLSALARQGRSNSEATVLGRDQRGSLEDAAFVNGVAITTADYDDTHLRTVTHPTGTSLAALLSFAEVNHLSGKDFLLAFVCGVEAQCAVANAISPGHYREGW